MTQLLGHYRFCPVSLAVLGNSLKRLVNVLGSVSGVCMRDLEQKILSGLWFPQHWIGLDRVGWSVCQG